MFDKAATEEIADWTAQEESGGRVLLRFMRWVALKAPNWLIDPLNWTISLIYALRGRRAATIASRDYLRRVLGRPATFREVHRHMRIFAQVFIERVRFLAEGTRAFKVDKHNKGIVAAAQAAGRGGILLGAHFGSFEAMRALDRDLPGLRVRYMMYPERAQASTALLREVNPEVADRVISLANGPRAMIEAAEALGHGDFVAFLGDRLPGHAMRASLSVPFLGGTIDLPRSPYYAAMAAEVPLILCFAPRLAERHYRIEFTMLYDGSPVPPEARAAESLRLAERYAEILEDLCRRHPYNWFNFFDIWGNADLRRATSRGG